MKKQPFVKKFIYSKLFLLVGAVVLLFVVVKVVKGFSQDRQVSQEIIELKREIADLEKSNGDLNNLLEYLESDEFVRQEGRLKFGLREEGENLVIVSEQSDRPREIVYEEEPQVELSNPAKWWKYFFN